MDKKYYPFIDGLRAVSILLVLLHHTASYFKLTLHAGPFWGRLLHLGYLGVDFFFVTSGFLITGLLIEEFEKGRVNLKRFYARRFFKIYPHYILIVLVGFLLLALNGFQVKVPQVLSYVFMYHNYVQPVAVLGHLWSIAIEEHFYLVFPVALYAITWVYKTAHQRKVCLIVLLLAFMVLANYLRYSLFLGRDDSNPSLWQVTHVRFDALLMGCLIKCLEPYFYPKNAAASHMRFSLGYFLIAEVLFLLLFFNQTFLKWEYYTVAYCATGCFLIFCLKPSNPIHWVLEQRWLRTFGRASYGIYLWHYVLIFPFLSIWKQNGHSFWVVGAYFISALAAGLLTTVTYERYFLDLRKRIIP
jgi:peptidoglycan/LPS O-acetylase OafA/YrhL